MKKKFLNLLKIKHKKLDKYLIENHMGLNNIKITLIVSFFIGILLYHFINISGIFDNMGIQQLWNLSGAFITTILFIIISHGKFLMRILMPNKYIGGRFSGSIRNKKNQQEELAMFLKVKQNFLQTIISGHIMDSNKKELGYLRDLSNRTESKPASE